MKTSVPNKTKPSLSYEQATPPKQDQEILFRPVGATAFFISLILLCLAIWFGIYWLMLHRI